MQLTQEEIKTLHNGVMGCPYVLISKVMPEIMPILKTSPVSLTSMIVDVKVHMLMPNQWPCIPNWHQDFVPRDPQTKEKRPELIDPSQKMWLWLSNPPLTEFKDGRLVQPNTWIPFTQEDVHRGTMSTEHIWRVFIRLTPLRIHPKPIVNINESIRRHTQVYLDVDNFEW